MATYEDVRANVLKQLQKENRRIAQIKVAIHQSDRKGKSWIWAVYLCNDGSEGTAKIYVSTEMGLMIEQAFRPSEVKKTERDMR